MRGLVLFVVLVGAVAGYRAPSYAAALQQRPLKENVLAEAVPSSTLDPGASASGATALTSTATTAAAVISTTIAPALPPSSIAPNALAEEAGGEVAAQIGSLLPLDDNESEPPSRRRLINYDQRQEGQYNIRADLENFMIVLIPPSPSSGLSLLDLLTKSALRRNAHSAKGQRKQYPSAATKLGASKYQRQTLKAGGGAHSNLNYLSRQPSLLDVEISRGHNAGVFGGATQSSSQSQPDFIEGRTPYHVDISASDDEQSRLHPDRQVDVLPPPYPLAYQHLIKPFHLEAEPSVIQALPPPDIGAAHTTGSFLDTYNQLLTTETDGGAHSTPKEGSYYRRASRAIHNTDFLNSNSIAPVNMDKIMSTKLHPAWHVLLPLYLDEMSAGAAGLYPPIDAPKLSDYMGGKGGGGVIRSFELERNEEHEREQHLEDKHHMPPYAVRAEDDIEMTFGSGSGSGSGSSSATSFISDSLAKSLLSDGLERCAPGHRRDSYGVCREIEGY